MTSRVFAAVVPPADVVEHLDHFLDPRRDAAGADALRWTRPEHLHLTLAFMESVEDHRVDDYVDRLADGLAGTPIPDLRLGGPVAFPDVATARVLAVGVQPESAGADVVLERMAGRARNAAVTSGIEVDGARFRPHVTIARLRHPTEVTRWVHVLETYSGPSWPVYEVAVIASHLGEGPRGTPRYETLAEIPIGA
jgi:2'-5' RNA ligase